MTDGYELSDFNKVIQRAITGGTGKYNEARGEAEHTLLGFNATEGVVLRYKVTAKKAS